MQYFPVMRRTAGRIVVCNFSGICGSKLSTNAPVCIIGGIAGGI
jgi:hypothetical protein